MKKFGTPNGAGPGNANANVGFNGDGTPPLPRNADEFKPAEAGAKRDPAVPVDRDCGDPDPPDRFAPALPLARAEELCRTARPTTTGTTAAAGTLDETAGGLATGATGAAGGGGGAHDSDTDTTPNLIGKLNADTGVPAGTSTVNVNE
jgi:hypothetical protein